MPISMGISLTEAWARRMKEHAAIYGYSFSPSGGGYGDPLDRPAEQVLEDVLEDFITPEHAREAYGVVLKPADNGFAWTLDIDATAALRASMGN